jgi:hypothetical protein
MANESGALVLRPKPDEPGEGDYQTICTALSESARGRWFLSEYARRNRSADTDVLLAALDRIEGRLNADAAALDRFRDELRMLLIAIRVARPDIGEKATSGQAAKLAALVNLLEQRIDALVEGSPTPLEDDAQTDRGFLRLVPPSEEPELPIPSPLAATPQPAPVEPPPAAAKSVEPIADPLAALMALSEIERIALFT